MAMDQVRHAGEDWDAYERSSIDAAIRGLGVSGTDWQAERQRVLDQDAAVRTPDTHPLRVEAAAISTLRYIAVELAKHPENITDELRALVVSGLALTAPRLYQ
jgi:hypothetical protein